MTDARQVAGVHRHHGDDLCSYRISVVPMASLLVRNDKSFFAERSVNVARRARRKPTTHAIVGTVTIKPSAMPSARFSSGISLPFWRKVSK